ncbi:unnamed protein product [Ceratitis capitata]|uniref:(Mediterranean fruit fly) hypothetical protein n=1 Tax=Ceratitis capitata TaxID=7213 RepID=A0A811UCM5_CERCA|nr:unnamed protein product [Ceratitis capitata]
MTPNIKIAQINLHHAVAALAVKTHKIASDDLHVVLAQQAEPTKRPGREEGSTVNIVVASAYFPGYSNIIPTPEPELLIDYCEEKRIQRQEYNIGKHR